MKPGYTFLFVTLFTGALLTDCGQSVSTKQTEVIASDTVLSQKDSGVMEPVAPTPPVPADKELNHLAALLAGMDSMKDHTHPNWDPVFIRKFSQRIALKMRKMRQSRLTKMREWNQASMARNSQSGEAFAFYPFSGGDLIHLAWLYPDAENYFLVAREDVGYIPDLLGADEEFVFRYLRDIDTVLRDIYKRSYFITKNMQEDTKRKTLINGMLPIIVWTIAQLDYEIISIDYFHVSDSAEKNYLKAYQKKRPPHGVDIRVRGKGSDKIRNITYLSCDISDRGFKRRPRFHAFLESSVPSGCNSFVKSASYLLHYSSFDRIRRLILSKSSYHIQDDTGIPYQYFDPNAWSMELHGRYHKPISAFSPGLFQKDLKAAYADPTLHKGDLTFSLGYHWSTRKQNQMIAIKNK